MSVCLSSNSEDDEAHYALSEEQPPHHHSLGWHSEADWTIALSIVAFNTDINSDDNSSTYDINLTDFRPVTPDQFTKLNE